MTTFRNAAPLCAALLLSFLACQPAWAQRAINRCTDAHGQTLLSDRPCVSATPAPAAAAEPGARVAQARPRRLSPACTRLGDAIDTAALRRVHADAVTAMRADYARSCDTGDRR